MKKELKLLLVILVCITPNLILAQFEFPSPSPKGSITQIVGDTKVEVEYERPSVRGRKIYGGLVPWNKVWRTGAGKCTKISFDKSVLVGNQPIEPGTYSLFTIPNEKEWVVIINSDTTLNGSGNYSLEKDIARFVVIPEKSARFYEALTIDIDLVPNNAKVYISWADISINFDIHTGIDTKTLKYIDEQLLTGKSKDVDAYGMAAWYLDMKNIRYNDALVLAQKMIDLGGNELWGRNIKQGVYDKMHLYTMALEEIQKGLEFNKKRTYAKGQEHWRVRDMKVWEERAEQIKAKQ
ncbi:DUF2911 domain-containing protein [Aurantibacter crassamenti]|uniref:DUF2911 domain-containing protein n=1 Tax=Aurantibacter crassamenti TaxID=1837375 RepID=UPI0019394070|nr:DUF2911 domain-containing protein [Aurantibacter crassamenti]MBM1106190.1 DUF2911 domain-containing protein [Aurantibacter crassamenti]